MDVRVLGEAKSLLGTLEFDPVDAGRLGETLNQAIGVAAGVDGNRVLNAAEAQAIVDAYQQVVGEDSYLVASKASAFLDTVRANTKALEVQQPKSTEVFFTSEGDGLRTFRSKILGPMQQTIAKADGRPVSFNIMIFSFTDAQIADGILQLARENPNATFRMIADWSQLSTTGSKQARRIADIARAEGLTHVRVKIKKDNPYVWDDTAGKPSYHHGASAGLNHHKGYVALIDGRPEKLITGSYNWSVSGARSNLENVMVLDRADPDNRPIMDSYQEEFEAFWNNENAALTVSEAFAERERIYQKLHQEHGSTYTPSSIASEIWDDVDYDATNKNGAFDINSLSNEDTEVLTNLIGQELCNKVQEELRSYGRFGSWLGVLGRVPQLAEIPTWEREQLRQWVEYGDGGLSVNTAKLEELTRAQLNIRQAKNTIEFRKTHGSFESLAELDDVKWIGKRTVEKASTRLTEDANVASYSGRVPGGEATFGYATTHPQTMSVVAEGAMEPYVPGRKGNIVPPTRAEQALVEANMAAGIKDMLRRAEPGQTIRVAMYGMSTSSPEFQELEQAIARGVAVRVVLYHQYNGGAIDALDAFRAQGRDVEVRVISSKVMHEKFGVVGDDVFNGSANWSSSSITKHSEDRFFFHNMPKLAQRFVEEFNRLWEKGREPADMPRRAMGWSAQLYATTDDPWID